MKAKINKEKLTITFTGIANESQLEDATYPCEESGCDCEQLDYSTKVVVTAKTKEQFNKFLEIYNR